VDLTPDSFAVKVYANNALQCPLEGLVDTFVMQQLDWSIREAECKLTHGVVMKRIVASLLVAWAIVSICGARAAGTDKTLVS
jgi:hypothetical protein